MVVIVENMNQRECPGWVTSCTILVEEQNETIRRLFAGIQITSQKEAEGKAMSDIHFVFDAPEQYW